MKKIGALLPLIRELHERIRGEVVEACERGGIEAAAVVAHDGEGDTIYAVDRVSEKVLVEFFEQRVGELGALVLIAEGLEGGKVVLPKGVGEEEAVWRIIVDPIDGTRGLMYQKRSGWILTGVAPNKGEETGLQDIELAVQTEIPLVKQHLADVLWALRGEGAEGERWNRLSGERQPLQLGASQARGIAHGFATVVRFFPGMREELAAVDEEIMRGALGAPQAGKASSFEDQYIASGGQLYEMMVGRDRFIADLRPLLARELERRGGAAPACSHPYDLCTELIARELGIAVTDARGGPLRAQLALEPDVDWVAYANEEIRRQLEPLLQAALEKRGWLD